MTIGLNTFALNLTSAKGVSMDLYSSYRCMPYSFTVMQTISEVNKPSTSSLKDWYNYVRTRCEEKKIARYLNGFLSLLYTPIDKIEEDEKLPLEDIIGKIDLLIDRRLSFDINEVDDLQERRDTLIAYCRNYLRLIGGMYSIKNIDFSLDNGKVTGIQYTEVVDSYVLAC